MDTPPDDFKAEKLAGNLRKQKFQLGQILVSHLEGSSDRFVGIVAVVYMEHRYAVGSGAISADWYKNLTHRPKTPLDGVWYELVGPYGAIVAGEDDLVAF